ncbi:hypothetical protein Hs30E_09220 [Lactococcus hodotermopsidis]|uniref:Uncharacterized protein n=1 Tax=Pseudolactococcus hodotermopsidis TaxID=2709157 RepID=A0A6A0BDD4_9LACT|nr:hypothetical protein [Lactococcus hodotermopsidis]GFH42371.1 hypothetical protein Hs30E_09220 [Lactococcus hodotermopsidis]
MTKNRYDKINTVIKNYDDNRQFLGDGYYRVIKFADNIYEFDFSKSGPCSTFESAPAIKFEMVDNTIKFLLYRDMTSRPIKFFTPESDDTFVKNEFEKLVDKFLSQKA